MSAVLTDTRDFIDTLEREVEAVGSIHPAAATDVHWHLSEMKDKFEDVALVARLMRLVRWRVATELIYLAEAREKWPTTTNLAETVELRHRADVFEHGEVRVL